MAVTAVIAVVSAASSMHAAKQQADAAEAQGKFNKQQAKKNAALLEIQRKEILAQGEDDAMTRAEQGSQMVGAQRVALAAQGISLETGSAAEVLAESKDFVREDIDQIRVNAFRESQGIEVQKSNILETAEFGSIAARNKAENARITGGLNAINTTAQAGGKIYNNQTKSS